MRLIYHYKRRVLFFSLFFFFFFFLPISFFSFEKVGLYLDIIVTLFRLILHLWIFSSDYEYYRFITLSCTNHCFLVACSTHTRIENHAFEFMKFEKKSLRIDKHDTILVTFLKIVRRNYWEKEMMLLLAYIQFDLILHTSK